jgi:hypothetical protein
VNSVLSVLWKAIPQMALAMGILAAVTVLAATNHLASTETYGVVALILGVVGTAAAGILASPVANASAAPHLLIVLAVIGSVVAMGALGKFDSSQIQGVFAVILGGGAVGTGLMTVNSLGSSSGSGSTAQTSSS